MKTPENADQDNLNVYAATRFLLIVFFGVLTTIVYILGNHFVNEQLHSSLNTAGNSQTLQTILLVGDISFFLLVILLLFLGLPDDFREKAAIKWSERFPPKEKEVGQNASSASTSSNVEEKILAEEQVNNQDDNPTSEQAHQDKSDEPKE